MVSSFLTKTAYTTPHGCWLTHWFPALPAASRSRKLLRRFRDAARKCVENLRRVRGETWRTHSCVYLIQTNLLGCFHCLELARRREITGNAINIASCAKDRPAGVRIYISDTAKLSAMNEWWPKRNARQTLGDMLDWIRERESAVSPLFAGS